MNIFEKIKALKKEIKILTTKEQSWCDSQLYLNDKSNLCSTAKIVKIEAELKQLYKLAELEFIETIKKGG